MQNNANDTNNEHNANKPEKYNGWTNHETWAVNLWLSNDQGSEAYVNEIAQECWQDNWDEKAYKWRLQATTCDLADRLKDEYSEGNPLAEQCNVYSDLLSGALDRVNWFEIAESWLEDFEFEPEEAEDANLKPGFVPCSVTWEGPGILVEFDDGSDLFFQSEDDIAAFWESCTGEEYDEDSDPADLEQCPSEYFDAAQGEEDAEDSDSDDEEEAEADALDYE